MPPISEQYMLSVHTAVLEGIAVFFYSTYSLPIPISSPIYIQFFKTSASALRWMRFLLSEKGCFWHFVMPVRRPPVLIF